MAVLISLKMFCAGCPCIQSEKSTSIQFVVFIWKSAPNFVNNSFVLFNFQQVAEIFGLQTLSATDIVILVSNGDGNAFPAHLEGVTFMNNSWYVVFKDILQGDMNCRVQYIMFYCKH